MTAPSHLPLPFPYPASPALPRENPSFTSRQLTFRPNVISLSTHGLPERPLPTSNSAHTPVAGWDSGTGGDAVNLYQPTTPTATRRASVNFGISPSAAPFTTFDNSAAADAISLTLFSRPGLNGAFIAKGNSDETGSPGTIRNPIPFSFAEWLAANNLASGNLDSDSDGLDDILEFAFGTNQLLSGDQINNTDVINGILVSRGTPTTFSQATSNGRDFRLVFIRRKDAAATGLTYIPQFSADLTNWENSAATPTVIASDNEYEAVSVRYPFFVAGRKAQFARVAVTPTP